MKHSRRSRLLVPLALTLLVAAPIGCTGNRRTDSVHIANSANRDTFRGDRADLAAAEFLVEAADARMMSIEMSQAAPEHSDSASVHEHAQKMVTQEQALLAELRSLASRENVDLPTTLSHKRAKTLAKLEKKNGKAFDKRYIRMMYRDHKNDVAAFSRARSYDDSAVSAFAEANLPQIEEYLAHITELKRTN